jgi:hypothetical protein
MLVFMKLLANFHLCALSGIWPACFLTHPHPAALKNRSPIGRPRSEEDRAPRYRRRRFSLG